jgi:hypothetical protein
MPKNDRKRVAKATGRPRLVNQVLVNRMVALRKQGFSHREIADKVERSERTVRRYTKGASPQVELPTQPKRVDVLAACGHVILQWRQALELDTEEVDAVLKQLRRTLDRKDPLTLEWFATDERARLHFLLYEFLRQVMPGIKTMRHIRRITAEIKAAGGYEIQGESHEGQGPSAERLLHP